MIGARSLRHAADSWVSKRRVCQFSKGLRRADCSEIQQLHLLVLNEAQRQMGIRRETLEGSRVRDGQRHVTLLALVTKVYIGAGSRRLTAPGKSDCSTHASTP